MSILQPSPGTHYAYLTVNCSLWESDLSTNPDTLEWILRQLTVARWYLDQAAAAGTADAVHRSIESARRTYEHITALLPNLDLTVEKHRQVQQELAELQYRLQALEE